MKIDPNNGVPIYIQIIEGIRLAALCGRYYPGDRLPPVRELALELRVNPNTVAKAYRLLKEEGILDTKPGGGNFIAFTVGKKTEQLREEALTKDLEAIVAKANSMGVESGRLLALLNQLIEKDA